MNTTVVQFRDGTYGIRAEAGGYYMFYDFGSENCAWIPLEDKHKYECKTHKEEALEIRRKLDQIDIGTPI